MTTRCGTFALAGRANAGKSTLLNALIEAPLAIVSERPQTTRMPVVGIRTEDEHQLVFVDPPGLLQPEYLLQASMLEEAVGALSRADGILYLHPLDDPDQPAPPLKTLLPPGTAVRAPVCTLYTRADTVPRTLRGTRAPDEVIVSAVTGEGLAGVLAWCRSHAPPGAFRYDPEDLGTQPLRFFVAEYVREAAFALLGQELPYALAAEVDEFREGSAPLYIRVTLYVERESQKGMVVGKGGRTIREIGARARRRIETFLATRVYLDLWVKTLPKWRSTPGALRRFGFPVPPERPA